jgi:hypothetical protein
MTRHDNIVRVVTTKGKANKYVSCDWVAESNLEEYKAWITAELLATGTKPTTTINFNIIRFDDKAGKFNKGAFVDGAFRSVTHNLYTGEITY